MPDFWDKLFKTEAAEGFPQYAIHGFTSSLILFAQGVVTAQQIISTFVDSEGNPMSADDITQASIATAAITAVTDANPALQVAKRVNRALRINAAAMLAELGMVDKSTAKTLAGV